MKRFILITAVSAALLCAGCQRTPSSVNATPTVEPTLTAAPIATADVMATADALATMDVAITLGPVSTVEATASVSATPSVSATVDANKGMLDQVPAFTTSGKVVDRMNDKDMGTLQIENVTEKEFDNYIDLLKTKGFKGEIESVNSEMRYGYFTDGVFDINVTYTVMSGYPTEFLLCASPTE